MDKNLRLQKIYEKTDGQCHICHKKLAFVNYGRNGCKGAWHIEHSIPKAKGGSDHLNNLFPACVPCNIEKGTFHTRTARRWNGNTRAPLNKRKKQKIRDENTIAGAIVGGIIGVAGGPLGIAIGIGLGGYIGNKNS